MPANSNDQMLKDFAQKFLHVHIVMLSALALYSNIPGIFHIGW